MNRIMPYQSGLCRPLDPFTRYDIVHTRRFTEQGFTVSLRPLYLQRDRSLLHNWVKQEYIRPSWKEEIPYQEIIQTLVHTAHCDFGQTFTGIYNYGTRGERPICEVQVFHAFQDDELGMHPAIRPGDYVLHLMPGCVQQAEQAAVILACTEYFSRYEEVKRILCLVDQDNERDNAAIEKAGFTLLSTIPASYRMDNLYLYTPPRR